MRTRTTIRMIHKNDTVSPSVAAAERAE